MKVMSEGVAVGDVMSKSPVVVTPETSLAECARLMLRSHVGSLLVQQDGSLHGILTEKDFVAAAREHLDLQVAKAKDVMEYVVITITPEKSMQDALKVMAKYEVRRLPVVDAAQQLVGLVTMNDLLRVEPGLFAALFSRNARRVEGNVSRDGECAQCGSFTLVRRCEGGWMCDECEE